MLILVAGIVVMVLAIYGPTGLTPVGAKSTEAAPPGRLAIELVENVPHTLIVPERVRKALGIQESAMVQAPTQARPLVMPGSTSLDPARVMRVRTRFNAQVTEIKQVPDAGRRLATKMTELRELRPGDQVEKGDVLAVVWSTDVGGNKSDLVDAIVQLRLDEKRLKAREELFLKGSLPEDTLNQTRRDVVSDRNAKERAERTLRTWNIPEREIQAVYAEGELASAREGKRDPDKERLWARSELIAPRAGTIVERNVSVDEYVADNTINLFTIADVHRILVIANPPEDMLPGLLSLEPEQRRWSLQMIGTPPIEGPIEEVGYIIDANQHTAVVKGYIDNPQGKLRAGQFVSATVNLPPPPDVVEVPLTALAEDGKQSFVFVQTNPISFLVGGWAVAVGDVAPRFTMRRVQVSHRFEKTAYVRSQLTPQQTELTEEEKTRGMQPRQPLRPGELIITSGVLELRAALEDKESKAVKK